MNCNALAYVAMRHSGVLPDHLIRKLIGIEPFAEKPCHSGSISYGLTSYGYDLRLGRKFKVFQPNCNEAGLIDPKNFNPELLRDHEGDYCIIPPNSYVLGESLEHLTIPRDIIAICLGKSTYARCAIIANITPLEPEWSGKVTIEISNSASLPAKVYAGEGIVQVLFLRTMDDCQESYADKKGVYQKQEGLTLPRVKR